MAKHHQKIVCPLCASTHTAILSEKDRYGAPLQSCCCKGCGLVFNNPIPDEEELRNFYDKKYRIQYKKIREPRRKHHARYAKGFASQIAENPEIYKKVQSMLDIGAGSGEVLALLSQIGMQVEGVEPTKDYADYVSKTFGVSVFNGVIDDFTSDKTYDLIRLNHVLEHMRDPVTKLSTIRDFMSDDGILYVSVPDIKSYFRSKSPGHAFHYGHIYNFTYETLVMVAARAGLQEVVRVRPTSIYFKKCKPFEIEPNPTLGAELIAMNKLYQAGEYRKQKGVVLKALKKLKNHLNDPLTVNRLGTPTQIIEHFVKKVKVSLS